MSVCGDNVLMLKPVPVMLLPVMETADVPVFDSVTPIDAVAPTSKFPKLALAGLALNEPCVPVPLRGIDSEGFVAFDVMVMLLDTAPVAVGANVTEKFAVAPAAICCPELITLVLNPDPVVLTRLIVIALLPEFVSAIVCGLLLAPTTTLPKFTLPGLAVRVVPDVTALPVKTSVCGEFPALSVNTTLPVAPVVDVGAN